MGHVGDIPEMKVIEEGIFFDSTLMGGLDK